MEARKEGGEEDARGRRWGKLCGLDLFFKKAILPHLFFFLAHLIFFLSDLPPFKLTAILFLPKNTRTSGEGRRV